MGDPKTEKPTEETPPVTEESGAGYGNNAEEDPGLSDRSPDER